MVPIDLLKNKRFVSADLFKNKRNLIALFGLFLHLFVCFFASYFLIYYSNRILPGISINGIFISGKTADEAVSAVNNELQTRNQVSVEINGRIVDVNKEDFDFEFLTTSTLKSAFEFGRVGNIFKQVNDVFRSAYYGKEFPIEYKFDENKFALLISDFKLDTTDRYSEPYFILDGDILSIVNGKSGIDFDSRILHSQIIESFSGIEFKSNIKAITFVSSPNISDTEIEAKKADAIKILEKKISLKTSDDLWIFSKQDLVNSIMVTKDEDGEISIKSDANGIVKKIQEVAMQVDREPSGQILKIENEKVVEFKPSLDGIRTKIKENVEAIEKALFSEETKVDIELALEKTSAPIPEGNDYGIKDVLGEGKSKFVGSIPSRVHNVGLASDRVSGILVAPGEVFSFNQTVGEVSKKTGYKSAYVISGGRTVLGDGGGLCQVSTTVFRAALDAGLKIVARSPHSYRVGYYEQDSGPGVDATVYTPSVDLKFLNDTPKHILIVSEFNKEKLTLKYTIYGTSDGRQVEITEPKILSKKSPPPAIFENDASLPSGKRIQIEHAVSGAVVEFTRKVTRDGVVLYDDIFKSNYRAWPAVYRVGP